MKIKMHKEIQTNVGFEDGGGGGGGDGVEEGGGAASSPSRESEQLLGVESFIGFKK